MVRLWPNIGAGSEESHVSIALDHHLKRGGGGSLRVLANPRRPTSEHVPQQNDRNSSKGPKVGRLGSSKLFLAFGPQPPPLLATTQRPGGGLPGLEGRLRGGGGRFPEVTGGCTAVNQVRALRPVLLLVSRSPVVGVPGLCWMWRDVPFACQRRPIIGVLRMCPLHVHPPPPPKGRGFPPI